MKEGPIFQLPELCPECGKSYWTVGMKCNKCGEDRSVEIKAAQKLYKTFLKNGGK